MQIAGVIHPEKILREEVGDKKVQIASIGPAGENLVRFAAVMNNGHRAAGRGGVGAVMGSKNLKAMVVRGHKRVEVADRQKFTSVVKEKIQKLKKDPVAGGGLPKYGTAILVNIINSNGLYPTRNFQESQFEYAKEQSGKALAAKYLKRNKSCFVCPIRCGRITYHPAIGAGIYNVAFVVREVFYGRVHIRDVYLIGGYYDKGEDIVEGLKVFERNKLRS